MIWGYHYFRKHPYVIICRGLQIDPSSLRLGLFFLEWKKIPRKLTNIPWKSMVGKWYFLLTWSLLRWHVHFSGVILNLRVFKKKRDSNWDLELNLEKHANHATSMKPFNVVVLREETLIRQKHIQADYKPRSLNNRLNKSVHCCLFRSFG